MSLTNSLLIGRTALTASQVALQVTGNNIANASTPGYSRQRISFDPLQGGRFSQGVFVGGGVGVESVRRVINPALAERLRSSNSQLASASVEVQIASSVESITRELTGADLSSQLSAFFNSFSELANNPASGATRATAIAQGSALAGFVRDQRADLLQQRGLIESELEIVSLRADEILTEIASLNVAVTNSELGSGENSALRDQRDALLDELSGLIDINTIEAPNGAIDVLTGSTPLVLNNVSRGIEFEVRTVNNDTEVRIRTREDDPETIVADGGRIPALIDQYETGVSAVINDLDAVASQLIYQVNRLHSIGRADAPTTSATGTQSVPLPDRSLAFNDPANSTFAGLPFSIENGSLTVRVTGPDGITADTTIDIDLDGIDATGAPGFGDDTTLDDVVAALNAIPNLNAGLTSDGRLTLNTDAGYDVSFVDDSAGVMAVLGINTYFEGTGASDIAVRAELESDPSRLILGASPGSNETSLAIANLRDAALEDFDGQTLTKRWLETVERTAVRASSAVTRFEALSSVNQSLSAQEQGLSGVSLDEESVNLITYQQQYNGAARFISTVNELTNLLISLV